MPNCCGEDRNTPFCPECGEPLANKDVLQLLKHCRNQAKSRNKLLGRHLKSLQDSDKLDDEEKSRREVSAGIRLGKWQRWTDALEELLKEPTKEPRRRNYER